MTQTKTFHLHEATLTQIQAAIAAKEISARELVQLYLNRIEAYDRQGPKINSIITLNPYVLDEADRLDTAVAQSGASGPLHGVPVILKDQMDAEGMPTTLGSVMFKNYFPDRDAYVTEKLKQAGAIILAKAALGELGQGDTHGSLFGSTRNPYALERTAGGSSGGPGAGVSANFGAVAIGQEGVASIRRPAAWNSVVGMRPTAGLVSRSGVWDGWPSTNGSLGPLTRSVSDAAKLLDIIVGYDAEDPVTSLGVGQKPASYLDALHRAGLKGARIGILRESMGIGAEPESEDFAKVSRVFDKAVDEIRAAGATVVDPIVIPQLNELLAKRAAFAPEEPFEVYFSRSARRPIATRQELVARPEFADVMRRRTRTAYGDANFGQYLEARERLMINLMKTMADHQLDAVVHKSVEHQPTLISEGINPPYVGQKGATHLNTYLIYVPSISVPAGYTADGLPVGITFLGRPYSDGAMLRLAYAYEQATQHRQPPSSTPPLPGEP